MAQDGFGWIYLLFFLAIPLSRIIPQVIRRRKNKSSEKINPTPRSYQPPKETLEPFQKTTYMEDIPSKMKPHSLEMLVLGELTRGVKNFNSIQKNLGMDTAKLDETLESLENQGLMKVKIKQGIFGVKIELIPTEEGSKRFYS